jgi:hypothetical protein
MKLKVTKFVDEIIDIPADIIQPFIDVFIDVKDYTSYEERERLTNYLKNTHGEIIKTDISSVYDNENIFYEE